jgi:hypothetical protein
MSKSKEEIEIERRELDEQLKYIGVEGGVDAPITDDYKDPITLQGVLNVANMLPKNKGKPYSINKNTGKVDKINGGKRQKTRRRSKKSKKRKSKKRKSTFKKSRAKRRTK